MESSILKDKIILIVDDYKINTDLLSLFVNDAGAIPLTAYNGLQCIEIIKKQPVDMILMDRNMPVMDGIAATKIIRDLPQGKNIIIIGISGSDEEKDFDICIQAGMNATTSKLTLNDEILLEIASRFLVPDCTGTPELPAAVKTTLCQDKVISDDNSCNQSVIDYGKALKEFENDHDLLNSLIMEFNRINHSQLKLMQTALINSDFDCIRRESHGIKGGAANLYAIPLMEAAKSLEAACKQHAEKDIISTLLENFSSALDSFDKFINAEIPQKTYNTNSA